MGGPLELEHHPITLFRNRPQAHPLYYVDEGRFRRHNRMAADAEAVIVVAGSSSAFGLPCGDERTWPALVERILLRVQQRPVRVLNAGVVGATTPLIRHQLLDLFADLKPSHLVVLGGWSDWFNPVYHQRPAELLGHHSTFFRIEEKLGAPELPANVFPAPAKMLDDIVRFMVLEWRRLHQLATRFGVPLTYFVQPMWSPHPGASASEKALEGYIGREITSYFEHLRGVQERLPSLVDRLSEETGWTPHFVPASTIRAKGVKFVDYIHFTEAVHRWFAVHVCEHLAASAEGRRVMEHKLSRPAHAPPWRTLSLPHGYPGAFSALTPGWRDLQLRLATENGIHVVSHRSSAIDGRPVAVDLVLPQVSPRWKLAQWRIVDPLMVDHPNPVPSGFGDASHSQTAIHTLPLDTEVFDKWAGWGPVERFGHTTGPPFRWIERGRAWVQFPPQQPPTFLRLEARPLDARADTWMHVSLDNIEIGSVPMEAVWATYWIRVPEWLGHVQGRILLSFEPLYSPSDLGIGDDPRMLSCSLLDISWVSVSATG